MKFLRSSTRAIAVLAIALATVVAGANLAAANLLSDPGFDLLDTSAGDQPAGNSPAWSQFNDAFITSTAATPLSPDNALKIFGPFFAGGGAGVVQAAPGGAAEGQLWEASAFAQNWSGDALGDGNFAVVKIEFLDASNAVIGAAESPHIDNTLTPDVWQEFSVQATAPAGTAGAQIVLVHVQLDPITGGSVFFDNASLSFVPEPTTAGLAGLALLGFVGLGRRRHPRAA